MGLLRDLFLLFLTYIPGNTGNRLRNRYYRKKLRFLHPSAILDIGVSILNPDSISIGANTHIDRFCILIGGAPGTMDTREIKDIPNPCFTASNGELTIGENCHIGAMCLLSGIGGLQIENTVTLSASTKVYSLTHHYRSFLHPDDHRYCFGTNAPHKFQSLIRGPIVIKSNVGVASNCVILPGVTLESESFVCIGSVVQRNVGHNQIVAGNPSKYLKDRYLDQ